MRDFSNFAACRSNPKWEAMNQRLHSIYKREGDIRDEFVRDYTRILHCTAFRRLKHKTQVFFSPQSDHICTRIEHVLHVESISTTIARALNLNIELTRTISIAHDLGHPPFGHKGEKAIKDLFEKHVGRNFWHEQNGLFFVDNIELLEDDERNKQPLNLTYAVRDGIISHCGEVNQNHILPRDEAIDLNVLEQPNQAAPFSFEASVVKMADNISYVGRDIEDAFKLNILNDDQINELSEIISNYTHKKLNNSIIINHLIKDICENSTPEKGIAFSNETNEMLGYLKKFNNIYIYQQSRVIRADSYFVLIIKEIFDLLSKCFDGANTENNLGKLSKSYPNLPANFLKWLKCYYFGERSPNLKNNPIYHIEDEKEYLTAVLHYISGMSDNYAIDTYNEIISF